jgi:hypothetical protein
VLKGLRSGGLGGTPPIAVPGESGPGPPPGDVPPGCSPDADAEDGRFLAGVFLPALRKPCRPHKEGSPKGRLGPARGHSSAAGQHDEPGVSARQARRF